MDAHEAPLEGVLKVGMRGKVCMKSSRFNEAKLSSAMMPPTEAYQITYALLEGERLCNHQFLVTCSLIEAKRSELHIMGGPQKHR